MTNAKPASRRRSRLLLRAALGGLFVILAVVAGWRFMNPADPLEQGQRAYQRGDWQTAETFAREGLKKNLTDRKALGLLARTSARQGRDAAAQGLFRQLGAADAEAEDLYLLGSILLRQRDSGQAMLMLERAKKLDPAHRETLASLGNLYLESDFPKAADELATTLLSTDAGNADALWTQGRARESIGDTVGASRAFAAILQTRTRGPDHNTVRLHLARVLLQQGKSAEAVAVLGGLPPQPEVAWLQSRAAVQAGDRAGFLALESQADAYRDVHLLEPEPAPFLGSSSCLPCHVNATKAHALSHHYQTFARSDEMIGRVKEQAKPLTDPADARLSHTITPKDGKIQVEAISGKATAEAFAAYALGSGNRGKSMIVREPNGLAREYRLTHYAHGVGWDLTMNHPEHPSSLADALGQPLIEDSVRACVQCHATDAFAAERPGSPIVQETGIGCERCHGPGGNHLKAVEMKLNDWAIVRPQLAPALDRVMLCAQCHKAPRGDSTIARDSVRFPWPKLGQSRCFTESGGAFDCVTCHSPHRDVAVTTARYEAKCLSCHSGKPLETTHKTPAVCPVNVRSGCLSCHMPRVANAIPHTSFTDHLIRIRKGETP